uniref:RRP7 domain-containing protein n=1 Tax=Syphacia muris TaxID=451379 RepID=A0A0N5AS34_9BILA
MAKSKKVLKVKKIKKNELKKKVKVDVEKVLKLHGDLAEQSFDLNALRAFKYSISKEHCAERNLFLKGDPTNEERLIVTNVPPYLSADAIKQLFSKYLVDESSIKDIVLQRTTSRRENLSEGYRTFSVHLEDSDCVQNTLKYCEKVPLVCLSDAGIQLISCGPERYWVDYQKRFIPVDELQEKVDKFMNAYDEKLLEEKRKAKRLKGVPDEDGWITVTRKTNKHVPLPTITSKQNLELSAKKKKRSKEDLHFYSFQMKESKMKRLEELRSKFEEDKRKIAMAKAMRKFKPL